MRSREARTRHCAERIDGTGGTQVLFGDPSRDKDEASDDPSLAANAFATGATTAEVDENTAWKRFVFSDSAHGVDEAGLEEVLLITVRSLGQSRAPTSDKLRDLGLRPCRNVVLPPRSLVSDL